MDEGEFVKPFRVSFYREKGNRVVIKPIRPGWTILSVLGTLCLSTV